MIQKFISTEAVACANIALIKYWGKRDIALNLPAVGSISLTLDALKTNTRISYNPDLKQDHLEINNTPASQGQRKRVEKFLDIIREKSGSRLYAEVTSTNNFPTGAGLASSASAFAALSLAAAKASGLKLDKRDLSILSRRGSGSASRSIFGGIVEMRKGDNPGGKDDFAVQIASPDYWDLKVIILITSAQEKKVGSTEAMRLSADTSPYYKSWVGSSDRDLEEMRTAINEKDIEKLGDLAEYSALKMHALTMSSRPPVIYWNHHTLQLLEEVRAIRKEGVPAYFTIDAGPQVKVVTPGEHADFVINHFANVKGIEKCIVSKLGPDAILVGDEV
jgi:diphosphomevalonate decarboxylase